MGEYLRKKYDNLKISLFIEENRTAMTHPTWKNNFILNKKAFNVYQPPIEKLKELNMAEGL